MKDDLLSLTARMQMDVNALGAKLTELRAHLSALPGEVGQPAHRCETCHAVFRGPFSLAQHLYVSHDGPVPEHWLEAEARTAEERPAA